MVTSVTKLDKVTWRARRPKTIRKMVLAMSRDIRVLVINSPTGCTTCVPCTTCARTSRHIARDTLRDLCTAGHRLGMNAIKVGTRGSLIRGHRAAGYNEIVKLVASRAPMRDEFISTVVGQVPRPAKQAGIKATVYGHPGATTRSIRR